MKNSISFCIASAKNEKYYTLGVLKIFSSRLMFSVWRYVTLGATIIGAILTPSVDPITQIFMSSIIMILYFGGAGIVFLIERSQENITYEDKF